MIKVVRCGPIVNEHQAGYNPDNGHAVLCTPNGETQAATYQSFARSNLKHDSQRGDYFYMVASDYWEDDLPAVTLMKVYVLTGEKE